MTQATSGGILPIERLATADFAACQELVVASGWNQVPADWQLFMDRGAVFTMTDVDGTLAATAAILPFAPDFGWISMVLVRQSHRRRGLATALIAHAIAQLRRQGLVPMLDATPAGRAVYLRQGFVDGWSITRWRRPAEQGPAAAAASGATTEPAADGVAVRALADRDWPWLARLDLPVFGADRQALLQCLARRSGDFACVAERNGTPSGFLLGRGGRTATQIGPVIADDPHSARRMIDHALARLRGAVLIDTLERHTALREQLQGAGFSVERGYTRMALAHPQGFGDADRMMAIAGPELA
ncbi:MAG: GNAT family N-acetyltransferase [Rhodoferax sp.]|nr:GNAT family N-acetyltransferase [Rhodoferax sp.]